jgi:hypothetical protein
LIRQGGVNVIGLVAGGDFPLWGDPREDGWMRGRAPCWWGSLLLLDMLWQEPIIDSHDNVRTLTDLPWNNLSDERIKAIAGTGGVMGIKFRNSGPKPGADRVPVDDVVDHIDYVAGLVGVEHVGLGPDQVDRDVIGTGT